MVTRWLARGEGGVEGGSKGGSSINNMFEAYVGDDGQPKEGPRWLEDLPNDILFQIL